MLSWFRKKDTRVPVADASRDANLLVLREGPVTGDGAAVLGSGEPLLKRGIEALASGRIDDAMRDLSAAVAAEPGLAEAQFQLGGLLRGRGRLDDAEKHLRLAVAAQPGHFAAASDLGALLKDRGRSQEAEKFLEKAIELKPDLAPAAYNLAMLRIDQRRWNEAAALLRTYIAFDPKDADAQYWLGNASIGEGEFVAARKAYQAAVQLDAKHVRSRWGLAMAQIPTLPQTDAEQSAAMPAFAIELRKLDDWFRTNQPADGFTAVGAQQPFYAAYIMQNHRDSLAKYGQLCTTLMGAWARKVGVPAPVRALGTKCRVGIVSAHIHSHSVWHAILRGWVEHLDPAQFELHLFHTGPSRDGETEWAARRVTKLHHAVGDWGAWAKSISDGRFDVLIYPEIGMDSTTVRLAALRLARVQLASWGHPITTGLPTIDGFLSAQAFEPAGAEAHYTETLIALPRLGCCYRPFGITSKTVDLSVWGISGHDKVLLCAGTPFKYAPRDDALWVDIARRCRPCKLVFFRAEHGKISQRLEQRLKLAFDAAGLPFDDCVRFIPWQNHAAFFGVLDRTDVYLDSIGFSGFNTTMQAIERGVPIVAWEGEFMRGRFASGILRQAGLDEWVADTKESYLERVERLCTQRSLREKLREEIVTRRSGLYEDQAGVEVLALRLIAMANSA
jgi:protein O-GlcNAc transferase